MVEWSSGRYRSSLRPATFRLRPTPESPRKSGEDAFHVASDPSLLNCGNGGQARRPSPLPFPVSASPSAPPPIFLTVYPARRDHSPHLATPNLRSRPATVHSGVIASVVDETASLAVDNQIPGYHGNEVAQCGGLYTGRRICGFENGSW